MPDKKVRGNPSKLVPMSKRSKREASENGKKGGEASGVKRRENKAFREIFQVQLEAVVDKKSGATAKEMGTARAISIMINSQNDRDALRALKLVAKMIGECPDKSDGQDREAELTTALDKIMGAFKDG